MEKETEKGQEITTEARRKFLKAAGIFAVYAPPALMIMSSASADGLKKSNCNNGFGNGDQCAPGKSLPNNNAENSNRGNPN